MHPPEAGGFFAYVRAGVRFPSCDSRIRIHGRSHRVHMDREPMLTIPFAAWGVCGLFAFGSYLLFPEQRGHRSRCGLFGICDNLLNRGCHSALRARPPLLALSGVRSCPPLFRMQGPFVRILVSLPTVRNLFCSADRTFSGRARYLTPQPPFPFPVRGLRVVELMSPLPPAPLSVGSEAKGERCA